MWRKVFWVLMAVFVLALAAGCKKEAAPAEAGPIKIGAIFDLTGPTSDVGTPYAEGIKAYVEWLNAKGGINGRQIELLSSDYGYKVDVAEQLYSQFVQQGIVAFQGWGTGDTEALRSRIAADQIPFMSASYSHVLGNPKEAPYNFLVGTTYSHQAVIALQWIMDDWKAKGNEGMPKVAIVHHDSPFGRSPVQDAIDFGKQQGIEVKAWAMPKGATDYTAELAQIQDFGASYIIIHTVSSPAAVFVKNIRDQGLSDKFTVINLNWCSDELFIELAGDAAEGVYMVQPFTPPSSPVEAHKAMDEFLKGKGSSLAEKGLHFAQGWTTMDIMVAGIQKVIEQGQEVTGPNIKAALETLKDYDTGGMTYPITFTPDDHWGNKGTHIYVVENGQMKRVTQDFIKAAYP